MTRFILFLFLVLSFSGKGQNDSLDLVNGLHLIHKQKHTSFDLPLNSRVSIRLKDGNSVRGRLEAVTEDSLVVNGESLDLYSVFFVGHRRFVTDAGGALLTITGAGLIVAAALPALSSEGGDGLVTTGLLGLTGLGIGIIGPTLLRDGKRYYLDSDWKILK